MAKRPSLSEQLDEHERNREVADAVRQVDADWRAEVERLKREHVQTVIAVMLAARRTIVKVEQLHLLDVPLYTLTQWNEPAHRDRLVFKIERGDKKDG